MLFIQMMKPPTIICNIRRMGIHCQLVLLTSSIGVSRLLRMQRGMTFTWHPIGPRAEDNLAISFTLLFSVVFCARVWRRNLVYIGYTEI